jgi:hypothetical protein
MTELTTIKSTSILSDDRFSKLAKLENKLHEGYENRIIFRARYLMDVSVLDDVKHPTPDSKYWQANLERSIMYQNLVELSYDYREKNADIRIKEIHHDEQNRKDTLLSSAKADKLQIQIERMQTHLVVMRKEADDRAREIIDWTEIMDDLEPSLEFSTTDPGEHMAKSYPLRFAQQKAMIQQIGASDMNGAMNILSLHETAFSNKETLQLIKKENDLLNGVK